MIDWRLTLVAYLAGALFTCWGVAVAHKRPSSFFHKFIDSGSLTEWASWAAVVIAWPFALLMLYTEFAEWVLVGTARLAERLHFRRLARLIERFLRWSYDGD